MDGRRSMMIPLYDNRRVACKANLRPGAFSVAKIPTTSSLIREAVGIKVGCFFPTHPKARPAQPQG